jgi:DNA (cytosine-5)-methyltransferase 1
LQTFPESFIWKGTKTDSEQMIGNAVSVEMAKRVARVIMMFESSQRAALNEGVHSGVG